MKEFTIKPSQARIQCPVCKQHKVRQAIYRKGAISATVHTCVICGHTHKQSGEMHTVSSLGERIQWTSSEYGPELERYITRFEERKALEYLAKALLNNNGAHFGKEVREC